MIADSSVLDFLPDHCLYGSTEPVLLRCIQVDLTNFGLDRYGIVWSMAQPLVSYGINLLYLSTATAANVLVDEKTLEKTLEILENLKDDLPNLPNQMNPFIINIHPIQSTLMPSSEAASVDSSKGPGSMTSVSSWVFQNENVYENTENE